jgi:hypothetical protein
MSALNDKYTVGSKTTWHLREKGRENQVVIRRAEEKGGEGEENGLSVGGKGDRLSWCPCCSLPWSSGFFSKSAVGF